MENQKPRQQRNNAFPVQRGIPVIGGDLRPRARLRVATIIQAAFLIAMLGVIGTCGTGCTLIRQEVRQIKTGHFVLHVSTGDSLCLEGKMVDSTGALLYFIGKPLRYEYCIANPLLSWQSATTGGDLEAPPAVPQREFDVQLPDVEVAADSTGK